MTAEINQLNSEVKQINLKVVITPLDLVEDCPLFIYSNPTLMPSPK
jgi:hypothetical protein